MKLKKGDVVTFHLDVSIRCLNHDSVEIDLEDLKHYLNYAVMIYKEENDL